MGEIVMKPKQLTHKTSFRRYSVKQTSVLTIPVRLMLVVALAVGLTLSLVPVLAAAQSVRRFYVKPNGGFLTQCSSWSDACSLQLALGYARIFGGGEIWVAEGTYKPTRSSSYPRDATFQIENGVAVYGGFAGTETARDQRDWVAHPTVLSGDLNGNGLDDSDTYHVVTEDNTDASAVLDGFIITGGNANSGAVRDERGGGMLIWGGHPTVRNVIFSGNFARKGGGMANYNGSPTLTNVIFRSNSALRGGGMYNSGKAPRLTNVTFSGNRAVGFPYSSDGYGGGIYNSGSYPTLTNCILWGNTAMNGSPQIYGSIGSITYSDIQGDYADTGNINADPQFVDTANGDLRLRNTSPAINVGNNSAIPAGVTTDMGGNPRIIDVVDMGAYEAPWPRPPAGVQASDGTYTNSVQVTWSSSPGITSYTVYRAESEGGAKTNLGTTTGTSYANSSAKPGQTYYYWVQACVGAICSNYSASDSGWAAMSPPTNVQASDGTYTDGVHVSWNASPGSWTWYYAIYRGSTLAGTSAGTSYVDSSASPGVNYQYLVYACNDLICSGVGASSSDWGWWRPDTTTTITSDAPDPSVVGQAVTVNWMVTLDAPGSGTPAGDVTVSDGEGQSCTAPVAAGGCSLTPTGAGDKTLKATYAGDANSNGSSDTESHRMNQADTSTSLASSTSSTLFGQSVTFIATVDAVPPGAGTPTEVVTFMDGPATLGTATLDGAGRATFTTSSLTVGDHSITAGYGGDSNFNGSSDTESHQVNQADTSTSLAWSASSTLFGQSVTFTATVNAVPPGAGTPTGVVTFMDGPATLGTATLDGAGRATFTTSSLTVGDHSITAGYGGDSNFNGSSDTESHQVNQADTSTSLAWSASSTLFGQSVTFTATVNAVPPGAGTPTGVVTFMDGPATLSTATLDGAGRASFTTSSLAVGDHSITATYEGDSNFKGSSNSVSHQVNQADTSTLLASTANPSEFEQPVTFTATVDAVAPGTGTPTGFVTFKNGAATLGTVALDGVGRASFTISSLALGEHSISTSYGSDGNFNGSTSSPLAQTVNDVAISGLSVFSSGSTTIDQTTFFTVTTATGSHILYTWDFGDGTPPSVGNATNSHVYLGVGVYTAIVTATNGTNTQTTSVQVTIGRALTYLPMVFNRGVAEPDLVIEILSVTSDGVEVVVKNRGSVAVTQPFWVDVYFNPSQTPSVNQPWDTIASHGVVWGVSTPIPAGGVLTLVSGGDYYFPEQSSPTPLPVDATVYALVDSVDFNTSYGAVRESDEGNNLSTPVTSTSGVAGGGAPEVGQGRPPSSAGLPVR